MNSPLKKHLLLLAKALTESTDWTHSRISNRVVGGGTFFSRITDTPQAGFTDKTYGLFLIWFDKNWPADLDWPDEVPRPDKSQEDAA